MIHQGRGGIVWEPWPVVTTPYQGHEAGGRPGIRAGNSTRAAGLPSHGLHCLPWEAGPIFSVDAWGAGTEAPAGMDVGRPGA